MRKPGRGRIPEIGVSTPSRTLVPREPRSHLTAPRYQISHRLNRGDPSGTLAQMDRLPPSLAFIVLLFSGWINRQQQAVINYLLE